MIIHDPFWRVHDCLRILVPKVSDPYRRVHDCLRMLVLRCLYVRFCLTVECGQHFPTAISP